jgi:cell wall assembly regulator SMI1
MSSRERLASAIQRITGWMVDNDAPLLAENLADGASDEALDAAEEALGFSLPRDLRDLWSLHDGQLEEMNGFVEYRDLFDIQRALGEQEGALMSVAFLREYPQNWEEAGVTADEVASDAWVPFAGRDSNLLLVSGLTGRVFRCEKDSPPLYLLAPSVVAWAEAYADRVTSDAYAVEEGFGDYYLTLRDLAAERRAAERERAWAEERRYREETPMLTQCREAIAKGDGDRCKELFRDLVEEGDPLLGQAVTLLFDATDDPRLIAEALQMVLRKVTLTKSQWLLVAKGGELMGNNAIRSIAQSRAV